MSKVISPSAKLLFGEAESRGYDPTWLIPELVFEFTVNGKSIICHGTTTHLNTQLGTRICDNKVLAREVIKDFNMPYMYSTRVEDINRFYDDHHPLIAKPILGKRAEGIRFINTREKITNIPLKHYFFEKYIEGTEYRYLVLYQKVIAVQERKVVPTPDSPWHKQVTNLPIENHDPQLSNDSIDLAIKLHLGFVAVDWIITSTGEKYILELNSAPGITTAGITSLLLDAIILN